MSNHFMIYRVFALDSGAPLDTLELHVLARAYYAAWRALHGAAPASRHSLPMLNAMFDFDVPAAQDMGGHEGRAAVDQG